MSTAVHWVLETNIKDGEYDNLVALMGEMVEATKADEPGTTHYEWFISEDKSTCHVYERYINSAATMIHLGNFGSKFAKRFMGCLSPTRFTVYGTPDETVQEALKAMGPVYMGQIGGFAR